MVLKLTTFDREIGNFADGKTPKEYILFEGKDRAGLFTGVPLLQWWGEAGEGGEGGATSTQ
jgi:hypothetical protein